MCPPSADLGSDLGTCRECGRDRSLARKRLRSSHSPRPLFPESGHGCIRGRNASGRSQRWVAPLMCQGGTADLIRRVTRAARAQGHGRLARSRTREPRSAGPSAPCLRRAAGRRAAAAGRRRGCLAGDGRGGRLDPGRVRGADPARRAGPTAPGVVRRRGAGLPRARRSRARDCPRPAGPVPGGALRDRRGGRPAAGLRGDRRAGPGPPIGR
jgi:hypothetical protein